MPSNKLVMLRHGESQWNKDNLFCGWFDAELSSQGKKDASLISAKELKAQQFKFDIAFTSALRRAHQSLEIILMELELLDIPVVPHWRLNERHYGNLIGFNKRQMADKYGEEQVQIWRRSFDVAPPPITPDNPYFESIRNNPSFRNIPPEDFPETESLKTTMERVLPLWEGDILDAIADGKRVLIVAHGTVLRALVKHLENVSDENISSLNIPNSIPCVYDFDMETRKPLGKVQYLADENFLNKQMEKTASLGKR